MPAELPAPETRQDNIISNQAHLEGNITEINDGVGASAVSAPAYEMTCVIVIRMTATYCCSELWSITPRIGRTPPRPRQNLLRK